MSSILTVAKTLLPNPQIPRFQFKQRLQFRFPRNSFSSVPSCSDNEVDDFCKKSEIDVQGSFRSGLYLVATPIGNLEDITLRALKILKASNVILAEDTRHSKKLLQHYDITTPLLSYHKFNESQREATILRKLQEGQIVALISDAGTPGISDPGSELAKLCSKNDISVIPIPGPCAFIAALTASGLPTNEFTFVGFLPKSGASRRERMLVASTETATQLFYVSPHGLVQFLEDAWPIFGNSRLCVIARELTKIHEEFWRGTLEDAYKTFSSRYPKGEITVIIEGKLKSVTEVTSDCEIEQDLKALISNGHSISTAVKLVAEGTSAKKKHVYSLALKLFGNHVENEVSTGQVL